MSINGFSGTAFIILGARRLLSTGIVGSASAKRHLQPAVTGLGHRAISDFSSLNAVERFNNEHHLAMFVSEGFC